MITDDVKYVGVNDRAIDLFEGQYEVPHGMAYNSYVIIDEKIAVMDSVDRNFKDEWLENIKNILGDRTPDYLVVQHMEPDHSANIYEFAKAFPQAKIVSNAMAFGMMAQFFGTSFDENKVVVKDGDSLSLGKHTLNFYTTPMVHWPEVMMTYESYDKILFSADAFGKFGANDVDEEWISEARRYYFGIVGKFGMQVQNALKKLSALEIEKICPLHGPVLSENLGYYLDLYSKWSSYEPESKGVAICYTSIYGNTKNAVMMLKEELESRGTEVVVNDLARCDTAKAVADAFKFNELVLATTTYNGEIFPIMREYVNELTERGYRNRKIGIVENGTWNPMAKSYIKRQFEKSKEIEFTETVVSIRSAVNDDNKAQIKLIADELA